MDLTEQFKKFITVLNYILEILIPFQGTRDLVKSIIIFVFLLVIQGLFKFISSPTMLDSPQSFVVKSSFESSGLPTLINKKLSEVTNEQRDLFIPYYLLDDDAKEIALQKIKLKKLTKQFEDQGHLLKENVLFIKKAFRLIENVLNKKEVDSMWRHIKSVEDVRKLLDTITNMLTVRSVKKILPSEIDLKELCKNYNKNLISKIEKIKRNIIFNGSNEHSNKLIYYFYGPSGTGKSHLAKALANSVSLPVLITKCSAKLHDDIDDFLMKHEYLNCIIFIEEAGSMLNLFDSCERLTNDTIYTIEDMKILLDPDTPEFYSSKMSESGLRGYHDMSKVIFILTGNCKITNEAILSRLNTIEFPKVEKEQRLEIAKLIWSRYTNETYEKHQKTLDLIVDKTDQLFDGLREMESLIKTYIAGFIYDSIVFDVDKELMDFQCSTKHADTELLEDKENLAFQLVARDKIYDTASV